MKDNRDYSRGYQAGRNKDKKDVERLTQQVKELQKELFTLKNERAASQRERVFMQTLSMTVEHCDNWTIGGEKVNNAERYCDLAKAFTDNAIMKIRG